ALAPRLSHVHALEGLRWGAARALMDVVAGAGQPYAWALRDSSPVCHRNHLVRPGGRDCGGAAVAECRGCLARDADGFEGPDPGERRATFGRFLGGATRVFAPSADTAGRIAGVYRDLAITVRPHAEPERGVRSTALHRPGRLHRVAVLGGISMPEGGLVLQALALDARARDLPLRFTIAGFCDPALEGGLERAGVTQTGRYSADDPTLDREAEAAFQIAEAGRHWEDDEILDLVTHVAADLILLPSIWPETYSDALTLALRTGLPVAAFDLGAPADRLRTEPDGHRLPYALADDPSACNDRLLAIPLPPPGRTRTTIQAAAYDDLMGAYYGLAPERAEIGSPHAADTV
ncbi:glycosyl transferase, partial [Methylobacterium sp. E-005]|nr:glycosyl transferase [Methylobacterium sp. E-005]